MRTHLGLVHAIGCTRDAHEAAVLYGDDRRTAAFATIDSARPRADGFLRENAGAGRAVAGAGAVLAARGRARRGSRPLRGGQRLAQRLGLATT